MKKITTKEKRITGEGNCHRDIKLTLLKKYPQSTSAQCSYAILSETETDISFMNAGKNFAVARLLFDFFLNHGVTPQNLEDIENDYRYEKNGM